MQTRIRIIKAGAANALGDDCTAPRFKSERQRERDTAATVKTWIADWHDRKRSLQQAADSLIGSMSIRRGTPTKRLTPELT